MFAPTVGLTLRNGSGNVLPAGSGTRMLRRSWLKETGRKAGTLWRFGWWQSASRPASRYYF